MKSIDINSLLIKEKLQNILDVVEPEANSVDRKALILDLLKSTVITHLKGNEKSFVITNAGIKQETLPFILHLTRKDIYFEQEKDQIKKIILFDFKSNILKKNNIEQNFAGIQLFIKMINKIFSLPETRIQSYVEIEEV